MFTTIINVLRGIHLNPVLTSLARGFVEGVAFLALYSVMDYVTANGLPDAYGQFTPLAIMGLRVLEGIVDKIDTAKQRQRDAIRSDPGAPSVG